LVLNSACSHKPTPIVRISEKKRSIAFIYDRRVEVLRSTATNFDSMPDIGSGVTMIAVDAKFEKMAYKKNGDNIKIVNITTGALLKEIPNTINAKNFHFEKSTNIFYYLSALNEINVPKGILPFANKNLAKITGSFSTGFKDAIIDKYKILVINASLDSNSYYLNDTLNNLDYQSSFGFFISDFVTVNNDVNYPNLGAILYTTF
jgi:hypothetical protein